MKAKSPTTSSGKKKKLHIHTWKPYFIGSVDSDIEGYKISAFMCSSNGCLATIEIREEYESCLLSLIRGLKSAIGVPA